MAQIEKFHYDNQIVKQFANATALWGVVGMAVGLLAALQLIWPEFNLGFAETTFGRIRPLHTNAVIFAFVGNGMFTGIYYSLQRLCKARMFSDRLSWANFWVNINVLTNDNLMTTLGLVPFLLLLFSTKTI